LIATDPLLLQDLSQTEDNFGKFSNQALLCLCVTIDCYYYSIAGHIPRAGKPKKTKLTRKQKSNNQTTLETESLANISSCKVQQKNLINFFKKTMLQLLVGLPLLACCTRSAMQGNNKDFVYLVKNEIIREKRRWWGK
jgi:hypothetical protein